MYERTEQDLLQIFGMPKRIHVTFHCMRAHTHLTKTAAVADGDADNNDRRQFREAGALAACRFNPVEQIRISGYRK